MFSWIRKKFSPEKEVDSAEGVNTEFISFRELFSQDTIAVRTQVYDVINESFGVYIEPDYHASNGVASYSFKILPDSCIEKISADHRPEFITTVNYFSHYLYQKLGIEYLLQHFVEAGKPYNIITERELESIIKEYMVMHERIMGESLRITLAEAIIKAIEG